MARALVRRDLALDTLFTATQYPADYGFVPDTLGEDGAISSVLDLVSFRQSAGQMMGRARHYHRDLLEESKVTSDPTLRAVFVEDAVSVSGDVITFAALALNQITGSSIPRGVAAVLIGRSEGCSIVILVQMSRSARHWDGRQRRCVTHC